MESMYKPIDRFLTILPKKQMNVIRHETIRKQCYWMFFKILTKARKISSIVFGVMKDRLFIVSTVVNMIKTLCAKNHPPCRHNAIMHHITCRHKARP